MIRRRFPPSVSGPPPRRRFSTQLMAYRRQRRATRPRPQLPRVAVPSFFTLMNLFCGFLAITQIHEGRFDYACWLIVLAGFFDALDGMMARLANATSDFGVELDSLSDVISFGLAPSYLVYAFGLRDFGALGLIVAAMPAICGAVRLARYNVSFEGEKRDHFVGMPIPVAAIFIVALILNFSPELSLARFTFNNLSLLIPIVFVLSFLMISNIPFDAIPKPTPQYIRNHPRKTTLFALAGLAIAVFWQVGLLVVLFVYTMVGIGRAVMILRQAIMEAPSDGFS